MEEEVEDTKRKSRNLSEKKRRDQFNNLLNELCTIVSGHGRKMDKSTVLKSTVSFLKNHNEVSVRSRIHDIKEEWKPTFISNEEFTHLTLDALDAFIMVFSATGHIKFVSENVMSLLGYVPSEIMNKSIFDFVYYEDRPAIYNLFQNPSTSVSSTQTVLLKENKIKFMCHLRLGNLDMQEEPVYELVEFAGYFRSSIETTCSEEMSGSNNRILFVCTGRLQLPQLIRDTFPISSDQCEFTSRHSLEWKYLYLDHRAPSIIGYLPFEVLGTSGYDYYHLDDLEKVATCHEALMEKGELTSCFYRFLTKGQQWIWLQTRFYITYHQWNSKPELVVCTHRVVSYADVMVKCENPDNAESQRGRVYSQMEDAVTEANLSMGDTSALSHVSENSDDYDRHMGSPSMSTGSGHAGNAAPSCGHRGGRVISAPSSCHSVSPYEGPSWTRSARMRYGSCESDSAGSSTIGHRRRAPHDANRAPPSKSVVVASRSELEPAYAVPVPVVVTPAQLQLQDHLQKKHEELQQLIVMQQEELRRIAEQLVMARLGLLPSSQGEGMVINGAQAQIMYEVPHLNSVLQASTSVHPPVQINLTAPASTPLQTPLQVSLPVTMSPQNLQVPIMTSVVAHAPPAAQLSISTSPHGSVYGNIPAQPSPQPSSSRLVLARNASPGGRSNPPFRDQSTSPTALGENGRRDAGKPFSGAGDYYY